MSADATDRMKCDARAYDMFSTIWHCSMMDNISRCVQHKETVDQAGQGEFSWSESMAAVKMCHNKKRYIYFRNFIPINCDLMLVVAQEHTNKCKHELCPYSAAKLKWTNELKKKLTSSSFVKQQQQKNSSRLCAYLSCFSFFPPPLSSLQHSSASFSASLLSSS